jgi:hypothetical protein
MLLHRAAANKLEIKARIAGEGVQMIQARLKGLVDDLTITFALCAEQH